MAGVYLSDLAQMGQDVAAQATALESQAATLEKQAAAIKLSSPSSAQSMLATAANLRAQAAKLRSQTATSGGVSPADALNLFSNLTKTASSVANTLLAKPGQTTVNNYGASGEGGMGLGAKVAIGGAVAVAVGAVVWAATRQQAPVRANGRRKKRRNCGAGCNCPACAQ